MINWKRNDYQLEILATDGVVSPFDDLFALLAEIFDFLRYLSV